MLYAASGAQPKTTMGWWFRLFGQFEIINLIAPLVGKFFLLPILVIGAVPFVAVEIGISQAHSVPLNLVIGLVLGWFYLKWFIWNLLIKKCLGSVVDHL